MNWLASTINRFHKKPWIRKGVIVRPTEPWEGQFIGNFPSTVEPIAESNGQWRLWYYTADTPFNLAIAQGQIDQTGQTGQASQTGRPMHKHHALLTDNPSLETASTDTPKNTNNNTLSNDVPLLISNLPQHWRPIQPVHIRLLNAKHRLYFWAHGPDVVRFLAADSDDGKNYRVIDPHRPCLYHFHDRAVSQQNLPQGLTIGGNRSGQRPAHEPQATAELISNDATTVYQLPDGTFELYTVALITVPEDDPRYIAHDNAAGAIRVIDRLVSNDGLTWGGRTRVLAPDSEDPDDLQFYYLSVTHTQHGRLGMLGHYRVQDQTMDIEWCYSHDGIHWERPYRQPGFARPETGPDCYGVYAPSALVFHEHKAMLFYTGTNHAHNMQHARGDDPMQTVIMLAEQSIDDQP